VEYKNFELFSFFDVCQCGSQKCATAHNCNVEKNLVLYRDIIRLNTRTCQ